MLVLLLMLIGASGVRIDFPKRASDALQRCCAHGDGCDALDCHFYRKYRDSYRYEALEAQCREPLLYALWPPHRPRSVRFDCLTPEHFLARLQYDINTSEAQATLYAKEVQFLCIVDPRAIAHPQFRDMERVLANGSRVHEPCPTTYLRGTDADVLWRYLRAEAAPAAFSEIHVRAPRRSSGVRTQCADGSRSLLTLNAAGAVRRLLPELGRRQRSTLRVLAHVHGVDASAHCVLCEYIDGMPRVKMKKFETSVSVYPYHRRVTEPQRRAPPWARRDRLRARDSLWCAGYRALLALHRPQIVLEGGLRYQPRRARRCHVLALGGARVIKLVLGDAVQMAKVRLPAYALHVQLRWAAAPARWKPESVSVVRVGAASGTRRRLARARWLPRRRAFYARSLTLRAPAGHYLTIDTLGVEYFEDGTPERFSRSIDGKLDSSEDSAEENWEVVKLATPDIRHPYHIIKGSYNAPTKPTRTTLSRTKQLKKSSTETIGMSKFNKCVTMKKKKSAEASSNLNKFILIPNVRESGLITNVEKSSIFATIKKTVTAKQTTDVKKPNVYILKENKLVTFATINKDVVDAEITDIKQPNEHITSVNKLGTFATIKKDVMDAEIIDIKPPKEHITSVNKLSIFGTIKKDVMDADQTDMNKLNVHIKNVEELKTENAIQLIDAYKLSAKIVSPEITTKLDILKTREAYALTQIMSPETTCIKVTNMTKTTATVSTKSVTTPDAYLNMSIVNLVQNGNGSSTSSKPSKTPWKIALIVVGIILLIVLIGIVTVCCARYGMSPCCESKENKELQDPGSAAAAAAAASTRSEGEEVEASGPLDVVVQSLVVAQGVTIALAARLLWYLWQANHGATVATTGAGVKVP